MSYPMISWPKGSGPRQNSGGDIHKWIYKLRHEVRWLKDDNAELRDDLDDTNDKNEHLISTVNQCNKLLKEKDKLLQEKDEEIQRLRKSKVEENEVLKQIGRLVLKKGQGQTINDCFTCSRCGSDKNT